jgi:dolichol-phosphate mannosyltransferase
MIEDYVAGWSSLIVSIYFVGGIIMILLGIIGVYLEVMFDEVKGRPLYIVKGMTNIEE